MDADYNIRYAQAVQHYKAGANWFYWLAGLSIITSLIAFFGGGIQFIFSLGITNIIDAIAAEVSGRVGGGSGAKVVALVLDLIITGIFVLFGYLSNQKMIWAYAVGIVVFLLDGVMSLLMSDLISVLAHAFVLFFLIRGFMAGRELLAIAMVAVIGLTVRPAEAAGIAFWLGLPWSMKMVAGVASDVYPIAGSRRGDSNATSVSGPIRLLDAHTTEDLSDEDCVGELEQPSTLDSDQFGVARPYSQAVECSVHVFSSASCVTGIRGRQPENGPMGSALEIAIRVRLPPSLA